MGCHLRRCKDVAVKRNLIEHAVEERERGLLAEEQASKRVGEGQLGSVDRTVHAVEVQLGDCTAGSGEGHGEVMEGDCVGDRSEFGD